MPKPITVVLMPYDPLWAEAASTEIERLRASFGDNLVAIHHIGSTAIPGISAKPILDLMPVVMDIARVDHVRLAIESLGYEWWGEYGMPGRRYCTLSDSVTNARRAQLHCFQHGAPDVERHLAFRDFLRAHGEVAHQYEELKIHCRAQHPLDSHAYTVCKTSWIREIEAAAVAYYRTSSSSAIRPHHS